MINQNQNHNRYSLWIPIPLWETCLFPLWIPISPLPVIFITREEPGSKQNEISIQWYRLATEKVIYLINFKLDSARRKHRHSVAMPVLQGCEWFWDGGVISLTVVNRLFASLSLWTNGKHNLVIVKLWLLRSVSSLWPNVYYCRLPVIKLRCQALITLNLKNLH